MEFCEFFTTGTLEAIDWGVLDLSRFCEESKPAVYIYEAILRKELMDNYDNNSSGIFRVRRCDDLWVYTDELLSVEIASESLYELKYEVIRTDNIWYVFDEALAREVIL